MAVIRNGHDTAHVRNIALVGHAASGKTTLLETMLERTGAIRSAGSVEKGTTTADFSEQEKKVGHSLDTAVTHLEHDGVFMNIIDTPGYPDFAGRTMSVLSGVDTAAVVINAQTGIELMTQRLMEFLAERRMCRMIIISRIDAEDIDLEGLLVQIRETFGNVCLPLNLPCDNHSSVTDCYFNPQDAPTDFSSVDTAHTEIIDQVVELDDELMELYLEQGQDISPEQLHDPFERALRRGHLIPVCFVSSAIDSGVNQLLNIFAKLMPSPLEVYPPAFKKGEGENSELVEVSADADKQFIGHVFKVNVDPYLGRIGVFRVHQGTVSHGDQVFLGERRKGFKAAHLYRLQGHDTVEVDRAVPGDIVAVTKVDAIHFDAVLHASHDEDQFHLSSISLPPPMYGAALELGRHGDEKKLSDALHKLTAEDPSLVLEFNSQANETVLRGMGDLHLRLVLERMKDEYDLDVETHPPTIAYRESVTRSAEGYHRHKKQTGGAGQFGEVFLRIKPLPRGQGFEFVNAVVGGTIPSQFIPAVEKGVRQVLNDGAIAGYPLQDIEVTVYDGKHHAVDSKEVAFVAAGKRAFIDAIDKAAPIVLEPIARVEVTCPSEHVGDITGHLAGIRGRISGNESVSGGQIRVSAEVPVSELGDYQNTLKSLTGGEGSYTMSFHHHERVPPDIQKRLAAAYSSPEE